jgi:hypothetical protein
LRGRGLSRTLSVVTEPVIYRAEVEAMLWALFDEVALLHEIRDLLTDDGEEESSDD